MIPGLFINKNSEVTFVSFSSSHSLNGQDLAMMLEFVLRFIKANGMEFFNHCMKICKQGGKCSNIVKRRQGCSLGAFFLRVFVFVFLANSRNLSLSQ